MLSTLLIIGEWQSKGKGEWDRFLEKPKIEYEDKRGNKITNYILPILFDLDEMQVVVDKNNLKEYRDSFVEEYKLLKTLSARNKKIYGTVKGVNIKYLFNSFFGEDIEDESIDDGHLYQAVKNNYPELLSEYFGTLLKEISNLKPEFSDKVIEFNERTNKKEISINPIKEKLELTKSENIVAIYIEIKSTKLGISTPIPIAQLEDYELFLKARYGLDKKNKENKAEKRKKESLCYASGNIEENPSVMDLDNRFSLNKMFGAKTYNSYLPNFKQNNSYQSYQVSEKNKELLDYASSYLLNDKRIILIAGIKHCILPEFQSSSKIDLDLALTDLFEKSDLLFTYKSISNFDKEIKAWTDDIYWINFMALDYPRDKKYLKTKGLIKDVSVFHFDKVLRTILDVDHEFASLQGVNWLWVKGDSAFNLYTLYKLIPVRETNLNKAYEVLKSIFENRYIKLDILYNNFCELILCFYYGRFEGYINQNKPKSDNYLNSSVKRAVFKYLAFIQVLKNLNLIDMEEQAINQNEEILNQYERAIQDFFTKMQFNQQQQAMFYLGRMLGAVEYMQWKKNIKKTVINLVNFNGLDRDDIERLRNDLMNKARQHGQMGKVIFTNGKFSELFDYNNWKMPPTEALFFLLTGYSFGTNIKEAEEREKIEAEENEN